MRSRDLEEFALFAEQGTGKTKIAIDNTAYLYAKGEVDALVVIAPNGVHFNWWENEIPAHMPPYIPCVGFVWRSAKAGLASTQKAFNEVMYADDKLKVFCFNIDAVITKKGFEALKKILNLHKCMLVVDESHFIKTPKAQRTKKIIKLGKLASYRRILTGTPVTQSPLDLYTQLAFLSEHILGFTSFYAFRNRYADMHDEVNRKTGRSYKVVTGYKHLEELTLALDTHGARVRKEDCLDLPPKLFEKYYVDLSKEQKRIYKSLSDDLFAELNGEEITTPLVLTKMLRLQQVVGGHFPTEEGEMRIDEVCPRELALLDILSASSGKVIIWSRFTAEIRALSKIIRTIYGDSSCVEYYGATSQDERMNNVSHFQDADSDVRFFIGQPRSGGTGITLHQAETVIYYSNDFSLATRLQSEDRAHRIGQTKNVTYVDIVANDTLDSKVTEALRNKLELASIVTQDNIREWI